MALVKISKSLDPKTNQIRSVFSNFSNIFLNLYLHKDKLWSSSQVGLLYLIIGRVFTSNDQGLNPLKFWLRSQIWFLFNDEVFCLNTKQKMRYFCYRIYSTSEKLQNWHRGFQIFLKCICNASQNYLIGQFMIPPSCLDSVFPKLHLPLFTTVYLS